MTVYHYCTLDSFMSIISNKSIWLSDITKSNDSMEIKWITRYINDIFDEEFEKERAKTKYFAEGYDSSIYRELVDHYTRDFFEEPFRQYSYFVCCFSEQGDLLSQWRGYAEDASGLAIGFDGDALAKLGLSAADDFISSKYFEYGKVEYREYQQKIVTRRYANELIEALKPIAKEQPQDIKKESMIAFNRCFLKLFEHSIFLKNGFFKEEKEWRLTHFTSTKEAIHDYMLTTYEDEDIKVSDIELHPRKDDLVPHIALSFDYIKDKIVKEVVIGPKCKARQTDVVRFLQQNGFNCQVTASQGTYR